MMTDSVRFRGHRCFKREWAGFDTIKPVNVIIGRNNTGKSCLLDLAAVLCDGNLGGRGWRYRCTGVLDEESLRMAFPEGIRGGELLEDHWRYHGQHFVGRVMTWETDEQATPTSIGFPPEFSVTSPHGQHSTDARLSKLRGMAKDSQNRLSGSIFRRLLADRDIRPEAPNTKLDLLPDGSGATNIIRRYIVTSNPEFPREVIQRDLLAALNGIFGSDGQFTEIQVKEHDEATGGKPQGHWEVFLGEEKKGLVALSNSGSGLKTVILVLLSLLVTPEIEGKPKSGFTFAFEELENNLHPALLRRLFRYLEDYAVREKATVFLTTHSSTALDVFGLSPCAQIIHVTHDRETARTAAVSAHFDQLGVISELGAKPSDLLQANGIVWVEGPSDCIYLNRWISVLSNGDLQEGRDYQCAFYGGALLARTQFKSPEEAETEFVNLLRVNANVVVVCDGDRASPRARVKDRVRRIRAEVLNIPGAHIWVTRGREIENYIPGVVLAKALGGHTLTDPGQYEPFFPRKGQRGASYLETRAKRKSFDKMDLAVLCAPAMDLPMMSGRFDWRVEMERIAKIVRSWNG